MNWTPQQREAIEYRNNNILLAAAAGSGKTAVLVQRIIELIEKDGVSVNELLVLTFTEAAAGEMREKIKKAIQKALRENPENSHLQRQRLLIHSANISTVHAFCLNTLKNNIHLTNLPVDFTLVSELENKILLKEALDEVLERFYANIDRDWSFAELAVGYGGIKNDSTLRKYLLKLHEFSRSMAYPSIWLNEAVRPYKETVKNGRLSGEWWSQQLGQTVERAEREVLGIYDRIVELVEKTLPSDHKYVTFFDDEIANTKRMFDHMDKDDYDSVRAALGTLKYATFRGATKPEKDIEQAQNRIKCLRSAATGIVDDLKDCFSTDSEKVVERIQKIYPGIRTLKNLVLMLDRCYTRRKREKSLLDFNDLEHEMLNLLVSKNGSETEVALKLREKIKAILVDEYQDTNNIQDLIFKTVSRENKNIFMVGDLKQSIYKFRNAVPKLFSDKYELYGKSEEQGHLIRLFNNFRSRQNVVDTVNFVFESVMSPEVGNIEYTEEEFLIRGAQYPDTEDASCFDTELHMICQHSRDEELFDKTELEARVAATRICEMLESGFQIWDKETEKMRTVQLRDMVILMRKTKDVAPIFEQVFEEKGIPVYSEVGHSYLGALEIQTVLAFLQIIDNPRQDIPLIAVMRSPIWGFSPDDLAVMRTKLPEGMFFDAVQRAATDGNEKAKEFLCELEALRKEAETAGVDRLICRILYDFGYYAYVGSLSHGRERQANLDVLLERANEFEHTKMSGLFSFMNYIETMRLEEKDMTPAKVFGEGENVVRIMSIHKSKGLEFPVVFLTGTANEFNLKDAYSAIVWDEQGGLGAEFVDTKMRVRYPSLSKTLVGGKLKADMLSEEMRLLYVALTRAREKLIITAPFKRNDKKWKSPAIFDDGTVPSGYVKKLHSYRDWLVAAFMLHPDMKKLREYCDISEYGVRHDAGFGLKLYLYENADDVGLDDVCRASETFEDTKDDEKLSAEAEKRLNFDYSRKSLATLPLKLSVSEVKRMQDDDGDYVPLIEPLRSGEMAEPKKITGAERGTVVHFVMQMLDPCEIETASDVEKTVQRLLNEKILSRSQAEAVDCRKLSDFFSGALGKRLKNAVRRETEFSFYTSDTSDNLFGNGLDAEILLQGTIDCFFEEEDGRIVLLDYKTDRVANREGAEKASEKYKIQMKYYKKALKEITGRAVDECYLYFLNCGEAVSIPNEEE